MAGRKVGTVTYKKDLSSILTIFRLMPEKGSQFPASKAGQYIALRRDDCKLTKKVGVGDDGSSIYGPTIDESGNQKIGPVTHSYSIASAPWEQEEHRYLEFYVVLEVIKQDECGRLSSVFMNMDSEKSNKVTYFDRITGSFTLDERAAGFDSVLMVGTGTGLAPFIAMAKQLHHEASNGRNDQRKYTILHTNRTYEELAYHQDLLEMERSGKFDFMYVPTVSRPTQRDIDDEGMGVGRANNVLRHMFGFPMKEQELLAAAKAGKGDLTKAEGGMKRTPKPELPKHLSPEGLRDRFDPAKTLIMTCGNPWSMADIEEIAKRGNIKFEMEEW
jgi:ferredoxin-NADP reductase